MQVIHPLGFRFREIALLRRILFQVEELEPGGPGGIEILNQLPASLTNGSRGDTTKEMWPVQWVMPVKSFAFGR